MGTTLSIVYQLFYIFLSDDQESSKILNILSKNCQNLSKTILKFLGIIFVGSEQWIIKTTYWLP